MSEQLLDTAKQLLEAQKNNIDSITHLINEMKNHDIRGEYRDKELSELKARLIETEKKLELYIENNRDPLKALSDSQDKKKTFNKSVTVRWGQVFTTIVLVFIAYSLDVDLSRLLGK